MLEEYPRNQLRFIVKRYGASIIDDHRRCKGFLKDLAPKHQLETNLLIIALEQNLVYEITKKTHTPLEAHLKLIAERLNHNFGIQTDYAIWAIESWALALDIIEGTFTKEIENIDYLYKEAVSGNANAQYNLGFIYESPEYHLKMLYEKKQSIDIHYKEALKWYKFAAEQEHIEAIKRLIQIYDYGITLWNENGKHEDIVKQDDKETTKWRTLLINI